MSSVSKVLKDDGARRDAISLHDRSILVEAGAGSGSNRTRTQIRSKCD